jgi:hypothetical protein
VWVDEKKPIQVSDEAGWTICRTRLLFSGPPFRTTAISPAGVL